MPRLNSLGGKLAVVFALILPILAWKIGVETVDSFRTYRNTQILHELEPQNTSANNLIAGVYEILMERLATNNALVADVLAGAPTLAEISKRRTAAVQKISAAYAALSAQEFPNKSGLLSELKSAMDKADSWVDEVGDDFFRR